MAVGAIGMLSFLLATGMAVDISHLYTAKAEMQNAADAAALAAASRLNSDAGGIRRAITEATQTMNEYDFSHPVTLNASNVTFAVNLNGSYMSQSAAEAQANDIRFVKVTVPPRPVGMVFASMVLGDTANVGANATAGMSVGLTMNKYNAALAFVEPNSPQLQKGQSYTLSAQPWNVNTANSYRMLEGSNANSETALWGYIHSYDYPVATYRAQPLNATDVCRRVRIGVNARFGDYTPHPGGNPTNAPPDTVTTENITYDQYRSRQSAAPDRPTDGVENRRIVTLPVTKSSDYNTSTRNLLSNKVAAFFIKRKVASPACTLEVEYVGERLVMPVGEYVPGNAQATELSIPLLYK